MEFLIGRSLTNKRDQSLAAGRRPGTPSRRKILNWADLLEQEPDPGLGKMAGSGVSRPCFLDSMGHPCDCRRWAMGLRYEYGMFKASRFRMDGQQGATGQLAAAAPILGRSPVWMSAWKSGSAARSRSAGANLELIPNRPSTLDRHSFRPADRRLRRHPRSIRCGLLERPSLPDYFDFQRFQRGGNSSARWLRPLASRVVERGVLYPDDSTHARSGTAPSSRN